jgi:hypothetical protein
MSDSIYKYKYKNIVPSANLCHPRYPRARARSVRVNPGADARIGRQCVHSMLRPPRNPGPLSCRGMRMNKNSNHRAIRITSLSFHEITISERLPSRDSPARGSDDE